MHSINKNYLIIVNPNAGKRKGKKDWQGIAELLSKYEIVYDARFTKTARHAITLTVEGIRDGYRKIIVVGGDGTMNEVVNGIFIQDVCPTIDILLGMIMVGTGNDWGRMFSLPVDYEEAIRIIKNGRLHLQDAGIIHYFNGIHNESRYFVNIAGLGFDAVVVKRTNTQKAKGRNGKALYMMSLLRSLIAYKSTNTEVEIDGHLIKNHIFTISIGIGKYSGGGMMQTPDALTDDGLFDITVIQKISKGSLVMNLKRLYDGSILEHPKIEGYRGKNILIDSDPLIHVEADGESLGHSPIEFQIIPKAVYVICGERPSA